MLTERGLWILVVCILVFFSPALFGSTFFFRDLYLLFYGKKLLLANALHHGEIPFWDPLTQGGQPFLGQPGNVAYYPFNVLFLILPPLTAMNILIVLQFVICGISAYFLGRATGLPEAGAFVTAATYAFCGYVLSASNLLVLMQSLPWAPALLGSAHLLVKERRKRWLVTACLAGSLSILGGGADMTAISFALTAIWILIVPADLSMRRRAMFAAAIGVLMVGLSLVSTFPALEVAKLSSRQQKLPYSVFIQWSVAPQRLPELIIPRFFGPTETLARSDYWGGRFEYGYPYIISIYFGIAVLLLAMAGAARSSVLARRCRILLSVFVVAGIVFSLGSFWPFFHLIYEHVPLIGNLRFPVKSLELTLIPMALLAGAGVSAARSLRAAATVIAAAMLVIAITFASSPWLRTVFTNAFFGAPLLPNAATLLSHSFLHAAIAAALFALAIASKREIAIAAVVLLDLAFAGWRVTPYAPRELFDTPQLATTVQSILTDNGKLYRTPDPYHQRLNVPTNETVWLAWWDIQQLSRYTATTFGIPLVFQEDYDGLALLRMKRMTELVNTMPWANRLNVLSAGGATAIVTPDAIASPLVERVKIMRAANGGPLYVYRNRGSKPLRFATNAVVIANDPLAFARLASTPFDPNTVILAQGEASRGPRTEDRGQASVRTIARTNNTWSAEVNAPTNGWVVFAESWFPGWRATVDGVERPLVRADVAFSAIAVPAGNHVITKTYRPAAPLVGLTASLIAALILAFWRVSQ